jgi:hypothetical protein
MFGGNFEVQQIVVAFAPIRGEMFIERAIAKDFFSLQRSEN